MSVPMLPYLRPVESAEDRRIVLRVRNLIFPHNPWTIDEFEAYEAKRSGYGRAQRFLMGDDAYILYGRPRAALPDVFLQAFSIDATESRLDEVFEYFLDRGRTEGATAISSMVLSSMTPDVARLESFGFRLTQTNPVSRLELARFLPGQHARAVEASILPFAALPARFGDSWKRKLWRLEMDLFADVPNPLPHEDTPFEKYAERFDNPIYDRETRFAALVGEELVGMSEFDIRRADPRLAMTHLTGVRREHRRKGIAQALKVVALTEAKRRGVEQIYTDNERDNPMYQLNLALGFRKAWDLLVFGRDL